MSSPLVHRAALLLAPLCLCLSFVPLATMAPPSALAGGVTSMNFPRIGNYNGYSGVELAPIYARYNLLWTDDSLTWYRPQAIQALHTANPQATILAYEQTAQVNPQLQTRYGTIYPGWWLLKVGSTLSAAINSSQTTIPVRSTTPFHVGDAVLIDGESMHVTAISSAASTLTVQRAYYSTAASHSASARIASHAMLPLGGPSSAAPWALNLSTDCPRNAQGQRWLDYLAGWMRSTVLGGGLWNGAFFDNTNDLLYDNTIDVNNDGVGDSGTVNGDNVWQDGIAQLFSEMHAYFPGDVFLGTGFRFSQYSAANGQSFYVPNFDDPVTYSETLSDYHNHMSSSLAPTVSVVNPATPSGSWSLQLMRYGLATTLLDNGVFTYDRGAEQNGTPWWFDEYDNGAGTVLSAAVSSTSTQLPVVHSSIFKVGDTVEVDNELLQVTGIASGVLTVTRGLNGTTATTHNADVVVATPAQVQSGMGYLGQPLGASYLVTPPGPNLLLNPSFNAGTLLPWVFDQVAPAEGTLSLDTATTEDGGASAHLYASKVGANDLSLQVSQNQLALVGGQTYTFSYWIKSDKPHYVHILICSQYTSPSCVVDNTQPVTSQWTQYSLSFTMPSSATDVRLHFELGDVAGANTWIDNVNLSAMSLPVLRRDFANGTVLVNPGSKTYAVSLPTGYCRLSGDQNPSLNNGAAVTALSIPAQDGVILRRCSSSTSSGSTALSGTDSPIIAGAGGSASYTFTPSAGGPATVGACDVTVGDVASLNVLNGSQQSMGSSSSGNCNWVHFTAAAGQPYTVTMTALKGAGQFRSAWSVNGTTVTWAAANAITSDTGMSQDYSFPALGGGSVGITTCGPTSASFALSLLDAAGNTRASGTASATCQTLSYTASAAALFRLHEVAVSGTGAWSGTITTH